MKLSEMAVTSAKKINKVMESRFGFALDFSKMSVEKAQRLQETITQNLNKMRHSVDFHTAERNPRYMELLTVSESLSAWLNENRRSLTEGEVSNAEVLLAAKDMVDSVQDAIEKVGKMQNEQLPQLLDSIRDQIGNEQSEGFKTTVGGALDILMQQLQSSRDGVSQGVDILTGQAIQPMELPAELPEPDMGQETMPVDQEETDGFQGTAPAVGGATEVGREMRESKKQRI